MALLIDGFENGQKLGQKIVNEHELFKINMMDISKRIVYVTDTVQNCEKMVKSQSDYTNNLAVIMKDFGRSTIIKPDQGEPREATIAEITPKPICRRKLEWNDHEKQAEKNLSSSDIDRVPSWDSISHIMADMKYDLFIYYVHEMSMIESWTRYKKENPNRNKKDKLPSICHRMYKKMIEIASLRGIEVKIKEKPVNLCELNMWRINLKKLSIKIYTLIVTMGFKYRVISDTVFYQKKTNSTYTIHDFG